MVPDTATRVTWAELLRHPDVVEECTFKSTFGLMAFHGGLEGGTAEIARAAAAASEASLYVVEQPAALRWHVPSSSVDPDESPALAEWLSHVAVAIAFHGYGRIVRPRRILIGGRNRELATTLEKAVVARLAGFDVTTDLTDIPAELRGLHPANPVNRPRHAGVQVELPPAARGTSPRPPDAAWGPGGAPARLVEAVVDVVRSYTGP
jgi:phage replication-related protein YjqB (UPF0714/DUF867 family)